MSRLTVDMAEVRAAAERGRRTAQEAGAVAAAVSGLLTPDTGSSTGTHLLGQALRQAAEGMRVMAVQVDEDARLLVAIATRYAAAEARARAGGPCA